ncbi:MAG: sugar phosphate isomerase/epimerase family protein [Planctomycetota bacterium]
MIELGFHTDNWRPLSMNFEQAVEKGVELGLKHVEFAALHGQNFIQAMGYDPGVSLQSNARAIKRFLDEKGVQVSQIDGAYPLMGPDGSTFGVQYVQQAIRFAAELECPSVDTTDGAFEIEGFSRDDVFRITCDNYRQCLSWAKDYDVTLAIEPHGPYTNDGEFMQRLFDYFDSEYLKFNLDTGNSFIAGLDPVEYCRRFRDYLVHAHIKDVSDSLAAAARGDETGIGSSQVPIGGGVNAENIKRVLQFLHETHWNGVVSIECHGSDPNMKASVDFLRGVLSELDQPA